MMYYEEQSRLIVLRLSSIALGLVETINLKSRNNSDGDKKLERIIKDLSELKKDRYLDFAIQNFGITLEDIGFYQNIANNLKKRLENPYNVNEKLHIKYKYFKDILDTHSQRKRMLEKNERNIF